MPTNKRKDRSGKDPEDLRGKHAMEGIIPGTRIVLTIIDAGPSEDIEHEASKQEQLLVEFLSADDYSIAVKRLTNPAPPSLVKKPAANVKFPQIEIVTLPAAPATPYQAYPYGPS